MIRGIQYLPHFGSLMVSPTHSSSDAPPTSVLAMIGPRTDPRPDLWSMSPCSDTPIELFAKSVAGVLQAEVNLKYVWQVVSGIKQGKAGYAYVVNPAGDLIAHPDISLVLQKKSVAQLNQVKAAFSPDVGLTKAKWIISSNLKGEKVISSFAIIAEGHFPFSRKMLYFRQLTKPRLT